MTLDPATGLVSVAAGTPAGSYPITYQICETLNPANCATAIATVDVIAAPIVAVDDAGSSTPLGGVVPGLNVLTNDTLNGVAIVPANVTITPVTTGPLTVNADGTVTVAPGTPAGPYTVSYTVCEVLNPANCDTADVIITVNAGNIVADADAVSGVNGLTGAADVLDVLPGDTLNGNPATLADVVISVVTPASNPGVTLDPATGLVSVAPGTPAGSYPITYQICETLNPANCATAIATVDVIAAPIVAVDDAGSSTPLGGVVAGLNVLTNDTLNGVAIVPANVTITPVTTGPLTVNADGTVTVAPGTPAGPYTVSYTVCEVLNPANCDTADVIITVNAGNIVADADAVSGVNGLTGAADVLDVLPGDTLNGNPATLADVVISVVTPASNPGVTLDPATGLVSVAPGTPAGSYPITYQICETLNPANCATAIATVDVIAAPIVAVDDAGSSTPLGGVVAGLNVLTNDTLNGVAIVPANVTITPVTTGPLTVNADGTVTVAPGTPAGPYTVSYTVCEVLNPANCDTADVIITVNAGNIVADADAVSGVNGLTGAADVLDVLPGDTLNGNPATLADVVISVVTPAVEPGRDA